jgi:uncharacterized protein with HEPN domain
MVKRPVQVRLHDILTAIDEAAEILDDADFGTYQKSIASRRGIEHCVEIISEAARFLPGELTARHPHIPWQQIRAIGNRLRHEYQRVDDLVMWRTATQSLPELRVAILDLIAEVEEP